MNAVRRTIHIKRVKSLMCGRKAAMGHHLFIREEKGLPMRDFSVELIRHLLIEGATRIGNNSLAEGIAKWDFRGLGVWIGIDERVLTDHPDVFEVAMCAARAW